MPRTRKPVSPAVAAARLSVKVRHGRLNIERLDATTVPQLLADAQAFTQAVEELIAALREPPATEAGSE